MKIHIIRGTTGEYADRTYWFAGAYLSEASAIIRVNRMNELLKAVNGYDSSDITVPEDKLREELDDPEFHIDYTGTMYEIRPIEIDDWYAPLETLNKTEELNKDLWEAKRLTEDLFLPK